MSVCSQEYVRKPPCLATDHEDKGIRKNEEYNQIRRVEEAVMSLCTTRYETVVDKDQCCTAGDPLTAFSVLFLCRCRCGFYLKKTIFYCSLEKWRQNIE